MKNIQNLAMLSAVIAFASCNSNKAEPQADTDPQKETITTEMDTAKQAGAANQQAKPNETLTVEGTVKEIANGKTVIPPASSQATTKPIRQPSAIPI
ncbi:MAG TPA: hypothetical protein VK528_04340 [Flavobacterium sp.]|nr:hypothetical protein [Flavobacterium sp.]